MPKTNKPEAKKVTTSTVKKKVVEKTPTAPAKKKLSGAAANAPKKGSKEAKDRMAKMRAMRGKKKPEAAPKKKAKK